MIQIQNILIVDYLTIGRRRRGHLQAYSHGAKGEVNNYRLVITGPEATNCFSINFQVFTNNNQHNFINIDFNLLLYKRDKKQKVIVTDQ